MPMIRCPECGREISDRAKTCPGCGISQEEIQEMLSDNTTASAKAEHNQGDILLGKKAKVTLKNILCSVCGKTYDETEHMVCPECGTPLLMLSASEQIIKKEIKVFRKAAGIQTLDLKVGQFFKMGHYGGEEVIWRVLVVEEGKALLISEKGLDAKPYNKIKENVTWGTCTLRKWLNSDFYQSTFGADEREMIVTTKVTADRNPKYASDPGKDTEDKIFLLSIQEAENYFAGDDARKAFPAEYAKENGAYTDEESSSKSCWWWLRSPGKSGFGAAGAVIKGGLIMMVTVSTVMAVLCDLFYGLVCNLTNNPYINSVTHQLTAKEPVVSPYLISRYHRLFFLIREYHLLLMAMLSSHNHTIIQKTYGQLSQITFAYTPPSPYFIQTTEPNDF